MEIVYCIVCNDSYNKKNINDRSLHDAKCQPAKRQKKISSLRKEQEELLKLSSKKCLERNKASTDLLESLPMFKKVSKDLPNSTTNAYNGRQMFNNVNGGTGESGVEITQNIVNMSRENMSFDLQSRNWISHASNASHQYVNNSQGYYDHSQKRRTDEFNGEKPCYNNFDNNYEDEDNEFVTDYDDCSENSSQSSNDSLYNHIQEESNVNAMDEEKSGSSSRINEVFCSTSPDALLIGQNKMGCDDHFHLSSRYKTYIELASILSSINAPGHVYKSIYKWAQRAPTEDLQNPIQFRTLVTQLGKGTGLYETLPKTSILPLPSGNAIKVTKFGFAAQLLSLLNDEDLMSPENLIFGDNIFKRYPTPTVEVNDINECRWYSRTQQDLCKVWNDVVVPLIIYIDKTFVKGKAIEPISFTLGK